MGLSEQFNELVAQVHPKVGELADFVKQKLPEPVESYIHEISSVSLDQVVSDFKNFNATAATVTASVIETSKPKKKKKKVSKAKKTNKQIQEILDNFESTWVPQINDYFNNYKNMKKEDVEYKYNYFQEMLLKELFKLDEVDTLGNPVIRENRKKVIQFIQDHQKRLDAFKKEVDL